MLRPKPMKRIHFSGYMEIEELPDDLGSAQGYVVDFIKDCVERDNSMTDEEKQEYDMESNLYALLHLEIT